MTGEPHLQDGEPRLSLFKRPRACCLESVGFLLRVCELQAVKQNLTQSSFVTYITIHKAYMKKRSDVRVCAPIPHLSSRTFNMRTTGQRTQDELGCQLPDRSALSFASASFAAEVGFAASAATAAASSACMRASRLSCCSSSIPTPLRPRSAHSASRDSRVPSARSLFNSCTSSSSRTGFAAAAAAPAPSVLNALLLECCCCCAFRSSLMRMILRSLALSCPLRMSLRSNLLTPSRKLAPVPLWPRDLGILVARAHPPVRAVASRA